jgi:hypothetical protein
MRKKSEKQRKADRAFRRRLRREEDAKIDALMMEITAPYVPALTVLISAHAAGGDPIELAKKMYRDNPDIMAKLKQLMTSAVGNR